MKREVDILGAVSFVILGVSLAAAPAAADETGIEDCQAIEDGAARLACYDAVAARRDPEPAPDSPQESGPEPEPRATTEGPVDPSEPAGETARSEAPRELTDDIGRETVKGSETEELAVRAHVARCVRSRSGKYVYYFENGQVWRQRGGANVRWDGCDFDVTISKDFFGYVMVRDGERRKVRIERVE